MQTEPVTLEQVTAKLLRRNAVPALDRQVIEALGAEYGPMTERAWIEWPQAEAHKVNAAREADAGQRALSRDLKGAEAKDTLAQVGAMSGKGTLADVAEALPTTSKAAVVRATQAERGHIAVAAAQVADYWRRTYYAESLTDQQFWDSVAKQWGALMRKVEKLDGSESFSKAAGLRGQVDAVRPLLIRWCQLRAAEEGYGHGLTGKELKAIKDAVAEHFSTEAAPATLPDLRVLISKTQRDLRQQDSLRALHAAQRELETLEEGIKSGHYYLTQEQRPHWDQVTRPQLEKDAEALREHIEELQAAAKVGA